MRHCRTTKTDESTRVALLFLCLGLAGCASHQWTTSELRHNFGHRYKVTVLSASIEAARPDGKPWHIKPPNPAIPFAVGIAGMVLGVPRSITAAAGQILTGETHYPRPSPEVRLQIGGVLFHTFPLPRNLSPEWQYDIAVDVREFDQKRKTPVVISVIDAEDSGVIGEKTLTLQTLLAKDAIGFTGMGSVKNLQMRIEPLPDLAEPRVYKFEVPVGESLESLAEQLEARPRVKGDWQGVPLLNGDRVRIYAEGTICPGHNHEICAGPEGFSNRWHDYNRREFRDSPHASLVGLYPDQPIFVGNKTTFVAKKSGVLLLGVNDTDVGNNEGRIKVTVEVNPLDLPQNTTANVKWHAPAW